ncbi:MAG: 3-oxoacyl-ACP synthase [Candidatus Electrothrix sp. AR4]|nr:3-oxoacyl-ACP synthase [Candidatus Electrothrix sp. AR4]
MRVRPVYICGSGIISPLGADRTSTETKLREGGCAIRPLDLFPLVQGRGHLLPVGQAPLAEDAEASLPRTHRLALEAAMQAIKQSALPLDTAIDAVILGTTTGGILTTEQLLQQQAEDKALFRHHGLQTVADNIAAAYNCIGPALTVSTACASGAVALALALRMLRSGQVDTVLAGGVDSLCRLTYFGFHSLQLVDRTGCKPFDKNRQGMAVAEGAGMLLLSTVKPKHPRARLLGAGLSCDAYHPAAPHPEGWGAFKAMREALDDAGLTPEDIGYINLHGTGTPDNDLAESKAVRRLFSTVPPLSSIKGASGHTLAAAGAIEAVVSTITVAQGLLPANTGFRQADPALGLTPLTTPIEQTTTTVLSNSFGFGGNNASLVIGAAELPEKKHQKSGSVLAVHGYSCLTGAGDLPATLNHLQENESAAGCAGLDIISKNLPPHLIRRLKRLPRMTLSLALQAVQANERAGSDQQSQQPAAVFMGTGWGALSDTYDFLRQLLESQEQFPSPTNFVGSVHNSPASQVAILFGATGSNITTSGGDYSFEQALLAAQLQLDEKTPALVLGADEGHTEFSPLFDASINSGASPADLADGGGAFYVNRETSGAKCFLRISFYQSSRAEDPISALINELAPYPAQLDRYALILAGIPAAMKKKGEKQIEQFMAQAQLPFLSVPVVRYRKFIGEFASASAAAAALAASLIAAGRIPGTLTKTRDINLDKQKNTILVLGLGEYITAVELSKKRSEFDRL